MKKTYKELWMEANEIFIAVNKQTGNIIEDHWYKLSKLDKRIWKIKDWAGPHLSALRAKTGFSPSALTAALFLGCLVVAPCAIDIIVKKRLSSNLFYFFIFFL
jgi:hypothetical protein